jgi:acetyl-CoA carboxylase biotin carboxyl carrier protein
MGGKDSDLEKIKLLVEIMKENNLVEIEIKHGDDQISLKREQSGQPVLSAVPVVPSMTPNSVPVVESQSAAKVGAEPEVEKFLEITSPMVGTFYEAPSPDSEAFVEIGSRVEETSVVCIIEAMKVMNEIKAEVAGTIAEVMVSNGQAVEFGQVLFKVKPD